jgi:hypothetical protein
MQKNSDALLRTLIKNWANRQDPPHNGRARLVWEAAHSSHRRIKLSLPFLHPQPGSSPASYSEAWTQSFFTWINENSFQYGLQARLS